MRLCPGSSTDWVYIASSCPAAMRATSQDISPVRPRYTLDAIVVALRSTDTAWLLAAREIIFRTSRDVHSRKMGRCSRPRMA